MVGYLEVILELFLPCMARRVRTVHFPVWPASSVAILLNGSPSPHSAGEVFRGFAP